MSTISAIYLRLPNWIGDVCMSLPSLHLVLASGLPVVVVGRSWARQLLAGYSLDGFIEIKGRLTEDRQRVASFRRQQRHTRARGILLPDSLSSALVFKLAGINSSGYRDDGRSFLLRWPIRKPLTPLHAVESWFLLTSSALKQWHVAPAVSGIADTLNLKISANHQEEAAQAIRAAGLQSDNFILIAPTATGTHHGKNKVWPHFDALTRRLQSQGYTVVMCPPASELKQAQANAPTAFCIATLNLGAFAALTRLATVVVCNDSGVSHLAAAANARQITIFGVTDRERTGPWSETAICLGESDSWPTLEQVHDQILDLTTELIA